MHLFLEGPVQTGKSTLIRECISPYMKEVGGFSSQRLWHEGKACAYRLVPPEELQLDRPYSRKLSGIFTGHIGELLLKDPSVFETLGVRLLSQSTEKSLILLDEIGGSELLVPAFREKLYQVLAGPVPCIGVLKLSSKASFMSRTTGYSGEVVEYNQQLRRDLKERFDAEILSFDRESLEDIRRQIEMFLERIF